MSCRTAQSPASITPRRRARDRAFLALAQAARKTESHKPGDARKCGGSWTGTSLIIDPALVEHAADVGGERTRSAVFTKALQEFAARRHRCACTILWALSNGIRASTIRPSGIERRRLFSPHDRELLALGLEVCRHPATGSRPARLQPLIRTDASSRPCRQKSEGKRSASANPRCAAPRTIPGIAGCGWCGGRPGRAGRSIAARTGIPRP